ncbi:thioesterase II family protein [Actinokineospora sp. G85]|uniref:thioesterase II family protein n=1 Tax=Actinokineospora sp. G85 TaxID=3406626 RepID=UPI003C75A022
MTVRLLCFPYAGGNAKGYTRWRRHLPDWIEVAPVQLPGRGERVRHTPLSTWDDLMADVLARVGEHDGPVALFGHSLGALLAFECARALSAAGREPLWLFASGHRAPHLAMREAPISHLPDDEFVAALSGSPTAAALADPAFRDLLLPMLRADFTVSETYSFTEADPLRCPLTVLGGTEDPDVNAAELVAWHRHTTGPFDVWTTPDDHFFVDRAPAAVAGEVAARLAKAGPPG